MLAFARRQELKQEPINIPELVRGMTDLLQRSIGPSIEIETRFPLGSDLVLADANQLEMALLNLVVNARDAMPDGGQIIIGGQKGSRQRRPSQAETGKVYLPVRPRQRRRAWMRKR